MKNGKTYRPDWLKKQRGLLYRGPRNPNYWGKFRIVKKFADELERDGWRVTHEDVRRMLNYLQRGYTTDSQTISRLLHSVGGKRRKKYANGHRVEVTHGDSKKIFDSLNKAADDQECSPESVRKWAIAQKPNRRGQTWRYVDPLRLRS